MTQSEWIHEELQTEGHSDTIRDIKVCPSKFSKQRLFLTVGDDKKVLLWKWEDELKLVSQLDLGVQLFRASFSFTGHHVFISGADKLLTISLDVATESLSKLS